MVQLILLALQQLHPVVLVVVAGNVTLVEDKVVPVRSLNNFVVGGILSLKRHVWAHRVAPTVVLCAAGWRLCRAGSWGDGCHRGCLQNN